MKLSTFIKSYKLALYNIWHRISDWDNVFVHSVEFLDDRVRFTFISTCTAEPGSIGIQLSLYGKQVDSVACGLDNLQFDVKLNNKDNPINDFGRVLFTLENIASKFKQTYNDVDLTSEITSFDFDLNKNLIKFKTNKFENEISTDEIFMLL
jgi:hypothetical protein